MAHQHRNLCVLVALTLAGCTGAPSGGVASISAAPSPAASPMASQEPTPEASLSPAVSAVIRFDADFYGVAAGAEGVWLLSPTGKVIRIDPSTSAIAATVDIPPSEFGGIAVGAGSVWVTDFDHDKLHRIDPTSSKLVASIEVGTNPEGLLVAADAVWVANHHGGSVSEVDVA